MLREAVRQDLDALLAAVNLGPGPDAEEADIGTRRLDDRSRPALGKRLAARQERLEVELGHADPGGKDVREVLDLGEPVAVGHVGVERRRVELADDDHHQTLVIGRARREGLLGRLLEVSLDVLGRRRPTAVLLGSLPCAAGDAAEAERARDQDFVKQHADVLEPDVGLAAELKGRLDEARAEEGELLSLLVVGPGGGRARAVPAVEGRRVRGRGREGLLATPPGGDGRSDLRVERYEDRPVEREREQPLERRLVRVELRDDVLPNGRKGTRLSAR